MTKLNVEKLTLLKLLLSVDGIGPGKIKSLLTKFKSVDNIFAASTAELIKVTGIQKNLAQRIQIAYRQRMKFSELVNAEADRAAKEGINIISVWDDDYPSLLKKIFDPPLLIYTKGSFSEADQYSIAVVGTRGPTSYGKIQAEKLTTELVVQNITIVSGMARGIDTVAHRSALKSGGRTIAVIGSGIDVIYPPENRRLFEEIAESGVVLTEFEFGTKPDAVNFPRRNRIIAGLSLGTLIIETGVPGGALQTASFALDQNREVFAVPGNLGVRQSEGTNALIQKGEAKLVQNAEDILVELELKLKPVVGKNIPRPDIELNLFEEKVMGTLRDDSLQIDKIAELTNLSTSDCLVHLLSLEFKGLVKQLPGKVFAII